MSIHDSRFKNLTLYNHNFIGQSKIIIEEHYTYNHTSPHTNNMISHLFTMGSKRILWTKESDENTGTTLVFKIFESSERKFSWRKKS